MAERFSDSAEHGMTAHQTLSRLLRSLSLLQVLGNVWGDDILDHEGIVTRLDVRLSDYSWIRRFCEFCPSLDDQIHSATISKHLVYSRVKARKDIANREELITMLCQYHIQFENLIGHIHPLYYFFGYKDCQPVFWGDVQPDMIAEVPSEVADAASRWMCIADLMLHIADSCASVRDVRRSVANHITTMAFRLPLLPLESVEWDGRLIENLPIYNFLEPWDRGGTFLPMILTRSWSAIKEVLNSDELESFERQMNVAAVFFAKPSVSSGFPPDGSGGNGGTMRFRRRGEDDGPTHYARPVE